MPVFSSGGGGESAIFVGSKTITGQILASNGTAGAPGISFASATNMGLVNGGSNQIVVATGGGSRMMVGASDVRLISTLFFGWTSNASDPTQAADTLIARAAAGSITIASSSTGSLLGVKLLTELTTIAAAATTDTTIQMPAFSTILAVSVRVTVLIPTAATFTVGDTGSAARFNTGTSVLVAAGTTNSGTKAGAYYNAGALSVRLTPNLTPADNSGRVRVTIHYLDCTPPTA